MEKIRESKFYKHKISIMVATIAVLAAAGLVVLLSDDVNVVVKLPKGYCNVASMSLVLGASPQKIQINDRFAPAITLIDIRQGSAAYFITNESSQKQAEDFQKVSQVKDEDTKIWSDQLLLRTTGYTNDSTQLLVAKKCE